MGGIDIVSELESRVAELERRLELLMESHRHNMQAVGELLKDWKFREQKRGVVSLVQPQKSPNKEA